MNDYACILIWDAHTRMGHSNVPYAYGISHTRMGYPYAPVWDVPYAYGPIYAYGAEQFYCITGCLVNYRDVPCGRAHKEQSRSHKKLM